MYLKLEARNLKTFHGSLCSLVSTHDLDSAEQMHPQMLPLEAEFNLMSGRYTFAVSWQAQFEVYLVFALQL